MWEGGLEILAYEHFSPVTGMKAWWILASRMASSRIACNIFHFISIPFNCSDTALKVAKAMIVLLFIIFASFLQFRARNNLQDFWPFSSRKPDWNFWYEYKVKSSLHPGQPGQPDSCEEALSRLLFIHHIPLHRISKNRHSDECMQSAAQPFLVSSRNTPKNGCVAG